MHVFVGTSGWMYSWNPDGFDWFVRNSNLNAVELNASFYRFPFPNQVKSWAKKGKKIRWAIKVNRLITHVYKFNERAIQTWKKFEKLFEPMDDLIDFYLFQAPPNFSVSQKERLEKFYKDTELKERFAFEARHISWFNKEVMRWTAKLGITFVSVDSPQIKFIAAPNKIVYLRMHGRTTWYSHYYTDEELKEIAMKLRQLRPKKVYVFFNNNHDMLENARCMLSLLKR